MLIVLTADQDKHIRRRIAIGEFASAQEAVRELIDEALAERTLRRDDDTAWAKPSVDESLAEVAGGEGLGLEEHRARNAASLAALRGNGRDRSYRVCRRGRRRHFDRPRGKGGRQSCRELR